MRIRGILLALVLACFAVARPVLATEPASGETVEFEDRIGQGIALRRAGQDEAALGVFLELEKQSPDSVRLLLHITTAALATGRWTKAYEYMQKAWAHREDPYFQRHKAAIETVQKTIAQRVGLFRAHGAPAGAEVRLSGEVVGTLPMDTAKPVEVGAYILEVSKPGYFPLRRPITITGDGNLAQEEVDLKEQHLVEGLSATGVATTMPPDALAQGGLRARWITWTLAGVAVAAAATSGVALAIRDQKASQWNSDSCVSKSQPTLTRESVCGNTVRSDIDLAQGVSIGAGVAAVAFGGAALIQWLATRPDHPSDVPTATARHTTCGPGFGSFVCAGTF